MNIFVLVLLTLNLLLALLLLLGWQRLRKAVTALETRQAQLDAQTGSAPALMQMARDACPVLSIRILNPVELAVQKHWAAGALGRITPSLLREIVGREAAKIVLRELPKYGAQADVRVVDGRG